MAQAGCRNSETLLLRRFEPLLKAVVSRWQISGHDAEDLRQVCRMALTRAIKDFRYSGRMAFPGFVEQRLRFALSRLHAESKRQKRQAEVVSLNIEIGNFDGNRQELIETIESDTYPEPDRFADLSKVQQALRTVPVRKRTVFIQTVRGDSFEEIRDNVGVSRAYVHRMSRQVLSRLQKKMAD